MSRDGRSCAVLPAPSGKPDAKRKQADGKSSPNRPPEPPAVPKIRMQNGSGKMPWRRTHNCHAAQAIILVELIVVLVILAILAAILVPALLGYIDEARNKQYVLQARNIVIAAQTLADEAYAAMEKNPETYLKTAENVDKIEKIADVADITVTTFGLTDGQTFTNGTASHDAYTIKTATFDFQVKTGEPTMHAVLTASGWTVEPKS